MSPAPPTNTHACGYRNSEVVNPLACPLYWLHNLAGGNYHDEIGLRAFQVGVLAREVHPFTQIPMEAISEDVLNVINDEPPSVVETDHITGWTNPIGLVHQWSLFNTHGETDNTSDDFNYANLDKKKPPEKYEALSFLIGQLPGLVNMRLNVLHPGAALSPHEEHLPRILPRGKVGLRARFHLPIITNPGAIMMADGDHFHFDRGNVYLFNNGCVHGAENAGEQIRAHLVWDQLMTKKAYEAMFFKGTLWIQPKLTRVRILHHDMPRTWEPSNGTNQQKFDSRELDFV